MGESKTNSKLSATTAVIVAIIGCIGAVFAAILSGPIMEKFMDRASSPALQPVIIVATPTESMESSSPASQATTNDVRIPDETPIPVAESSPSVSADTKPSPVFIPSPKCPSIIQRQTIEQWAQIGETTKTETQSYINDFDRMTLLSAKSLLTKLVFCAY